MHRISRLSTACLIAGGICLTGIGAATASADPGFIVARGNGNLGGTFVVSDGAPLDNMWEGPNPPRVPEGPCYAMWIPAPCPNG